MRVAVIGAGVVGLSTCLALLERGAEVTCYTRGEPMSDRSAGSSRIFRLAHVSVELVALARQARAGFDRWAEEFGAPLVDDAECVISGAGLHDRAAAMTEAAAPFSIVGPGSDRLRLPAGALPDELLIDHSGGVVDVRAVASFLLSRTGSVLTAEPVYALDGGRVRSAGGTAEFDAVIIAAGAGTCHLAEQAGIYTPSALAHHVRFTFPLRAPDSLQCWIDNPATGLRTYQHRSGPGEWAVGGHFEPELVAWEVGPEPVAALSRERVLRYVSEHLDAVEPRIVGELYCTTIADAGDGYTIRRNGATVAIYGNNLFKHAPAIGEQLAEAVVRA